MNARLTGALCILLLAGLAPAKSQESEAGAPEAEGEAAAEVPVCDLIETAAADHDLPPSFFTRLIWQESTFRPDAVSPKGAQGIAQFMPGTAAERGLADPFDPRQAIPASAAYLRDLRTQFGTLGLAAAAYNAGPERVTSWLAGDRGLPAETEDYVAAITGLPADLWRPDAEPPAVPPADAGRPCAEVAAALVRGEPPVVAAVATAWGPWGVTLASHFSRATVIRRYAAIQRAHPAAIGGLSPMVLSTVNRSRGRRALFEARVPADSREAAAELCAKLRRAGVACVVLKTPR